jgi:hypothetical protein
MAKKKANNKKKEPQLDVNSIFKAATGAANEASKAQIDQTIAAYPKIEGLQLGTVGKVSELLNNDATAKANASTDIAKTNAGLLNTMGDKLGGQADRSAALGDYATSIAQGPTKGDAQIAQLGASAMEAKADQVTAPSRISDISADKVTASQISPIKDVAVKDVTAAQFQAPDNVIASSTRGGGTINAASFGGGGNVTAAQFNQPADISAAQLAATPQISADIARARTTGSGSVGSALLEQAQRRVANAGQLSDEELRNASQGSRNAYSSRGLGAGASAASAELLNRATAQRQRLNEDLTFAGNVQAQDVARRAANTAAQNQIALANQQARLGAAQSNQQVGYNTALQNAQLGQRTAETNQQMAFNTGQANAGYQQQANLANQQNAYNTGLQNAQLTQQASLANQSDIAAANALNAKLLQDAALSNQTNQYNSSFQNAKFGQDAALANQDAALKAGVANQATQLAFGQSNANYQQQAALANQESDLTAAKANQDTASKYSALEQQAQIANQTANQNQQEQNRTFAINANKEVNNSQINRLNTAGALTNNTANILGQQAGAYQNAGALGLSAAGQYLANDPTQRALNPSGSYSGTALGTTAGMIGTTYGAAIGTAGDVASTIYNANVAKQISNNNNNAAIKAGETAGLGNVLGGITGGLGKIFFCAVAREVYGESDPAWMEFRTWLLTMGSYRRVSRYAQNGERIAAWISTRPAWKARLRVWMDSKRKLVNNT